MNKKLPIFNTLYRVWNNFDNNLRFKFIFLFVVTFLSAFAEILSLGTVVPFLGLLVNPEIIYSNHQVMYLINFFELERGPSLVTLFTVLFCSFVILAFFFRILLLWYQTKLSSKAGIDLSVKIYKKVLNQQYSMHLNRNSSEIIAIVTGKVNNVVSGGIFPTVSIISSIPVGLSIFVFIMLLDVKLALIAFLTVGISYVSIVFLTKSKLANIGDEINVNTTYVVKSLQEGLGSIRNVILDNLQKPYINLFSVHQNSLRNAVANSQIIGAMPRYFLEVVGILTIALVGYGYWVTKDNISDKIPILGAMAIAAQRILPLLQQSYSGWTAIKSSLASIDDTISILDQTGDLSFNLNEEVKFTKLISGENISFKYQNTDNLILKNINFEIEKGTIVGIIGKTGSGKSTLVDIISGLLIPTSGSILIDGKEIKHENSNQWKKKISYVPQNVFLLDASIEKNIALSSYGNSIDVNKIKIAAKKANISEFVDKMPNKYQTIVGESGSRLSGGQKQRIGIARALYKESELIIFDEATNALDDITENFIIDELKKLKQQKTIIIISHNKNSLVNCDRVFRIENGFLKLIRD